MNRNGKGPVRARAFADSSETAVTSSGALACFSSRRQRASRSFSDPTVLTARLRTEAPTPWCRVRERQERDPSAIAGRGWYCVPDPSLWESMALGYKSHVEGQGTRA